MTELEKLRAAMRRRMAAPGMPTPPPSQRKIRGRPMTDLEKLKADMDAKRAAYAVAYAAYAAAIAAQEQEDKNV